MKELTDSVMDLGASGVMVAPPPSLRTDDQIVSYFQMVEAILGADVPWVLQDHPVSTTVQMSTPVILRILKNSPTCVMLKHEDWPGLAKLSRIRAASDQGEVKRVSILTGNGGGLFLPEELTRGADGAMTGFAYPEMMVDVVALHARGERERAHDLFDAYLPLAKYEQQAGVGLAVRKYLFQRARRDRLGLRPQAGAQAVGAGHRRHPLPGPSPGQAPARPGLSDPWHKAACGRAPHRPTGADHDPPSLRWGNGATWSPSSWAAPPSPPACCCTCRCTGWDAATASASSTCPRTPACCGARPPSWRARCSPPGACCPRTPGRRAASTSPRRRRHRSRGPYLLMVVLTAALVIDVMKPASLGFVLPGLRAEYGLVRLPSPGCPSPPCAAPCSDRSSGACWPTCSAAVVHPAVLGHVRRHPPSAARCLRWPGTSACFLRRGRRRCRSPMPCSRKPCPSDRGWVLVLVGGLGSVGGTCAQASRRPDWSQC